MVNQNSKPKIHAVQHGDSKKKGSSKKSRLGETSYQLSITFMALAFLAILIVFVQVTNTAESKSARKLSLGRLDKVDSSIMLSVLRVMQGIQSLIMGMALNDALVILYWTFIEQAHGLSYLSLLALSPTTASLGVLRLLTSASSKISAKVWAFVRGLLSLALWLSGLVLFFQTSLVTVYDTASVYNVTAGIGPFNASLVEPYISYLQSMAPNYRYKVLPFQYFAAVYILVINPLISTISSPVKCFFGESCTSYLLSGGLEMVDPWVPPGFDNYGLIKIDNAPSVQIDFSTPVSDVFANSDCNIFDDPDTIIGIRFCVAKDETVPGALRAALFVCSNGTSHGACLPDVALPNITSRATFYTREATVVSSRSNYTIVSIQNTTQPVIIKDIDLSAYREALRWLLNYTAAGIPAPSSIAQSFWSSDMQLQSPTTYGILNQNFQSILAFPFWFFNSNNWANTKLKYDELVPGLPPQFYTTASVVEPYSKIKINQNMFILFVTLQCLVIAAIWAALFWLWYTNKGVVPAMSSYPMFDIAYKARLEDAETEKDILQMGNSKILGMMVNAKVLVKKD